MSNIKPYQRRLITSLVGSLLLAAPVVGFLPLNTFAGESNNSGPAETSPADRLFAQEETTYSLEELVAQKTPSGGAADNSVLKNIGNTTNGAEKKLRNENRVLKQQLKELSEKLDAVARTAQNATDTRNQCLQSVQKAAQSAHALSDNIAEKTALSNKLNQAQQQITALNSQLAALKATGAQAQASYDDLQKRQADDRTLRQQMEQKLSEITQSLNASQSQLSQALADNQALKKSRDALREENSQLASLQNQLDAVQAAMKEKTTQLAATEKKLQAASADREQLNLSLNSMQSELTTLKTRVKSSPDVILDNSSQQQAYMIGQAMADSMRDRMLHYQEVGMALDKTLITAGLTDALNGKQRITRPQMDAAWKAFSGDLQQHIVQKIKESNSLIARKGAGRKAVKVADGITYFRVKAGISGKTQQSTHTLQLTEATAETGRTISNVPQLTLSADDDMPPLVRDALPLLSPGAELEAYAIARTIYGDKPLPKGIAPFTVLVYRLKELNPSQG